MTGHRRRLSAGCGVVLSLLACGCGDGGKSAAPPTLVVLAAASTTDVVTQLAASFAGARVQTSFGGSGALARQILDGAPADLFVSASREWVDALARQDQLLLPPRVYCRNRLVCAAAPGSPLLRRRPPSPRALASRLPVGARVAIADAGVPAGDYARQSLAASGDLAALAPHFVGLLDVRAVLRAVAAGEVAAGFVYATDARAGGVPELFSFDPGSHAPIEYLAAVPRTSGDVRLATAFLDHLTGPAAAAILTAAGFTVDKP